jgi:hypothetical protein
MLLALNNCIKMNEFRPKIHIIANCANRKRQTPLIELNSIIQSNIKDRSIAWWEKLNNYVGSSVNSGLYQEDNGKIKASNLYVGSYWSTIRELPAKARNSGFEANLWVISAGYGLISSEEEINSYSATFTPSDKNSVTNGETDASKRIEHLKYWWELISNYSLPQSSHPRRLNQLLRENSNDYFLVVASADYLSAVEEDLLEGINTLSSRKNIVIISSKSFSNEILQQNIIPADARLQCNGDCRSECEKHLIPRGIRGTISAALAGKIIEKASENGFDAEQLKQFVETRVEQCPELINLNRTRLDDTAVRKFINDELGKSRSASCTSLLRKLRNNGQACEQKRFKEIYWSVKEGVS